MATGKQKDDRIPKEEWDKLSNEEKKEIIAKRRIKAKPPKTNDWQWYAISEQIAKDFGSVNFSLIPGSEFKLQVLRKQAGTNTFLAISAGTRMPLVMAIDYIPTIGSGVKKSDGVNLAARQLYQAVRRKNSGAKNYEAPDLMMYILAMRDIYREYFELRRAVGLAALYELENHGLPEAVFQALRIDLEDLTANIAQYRGALNLAAAKINAMAVPKYFKAFDRAAYISSYIFGDSTSIRGQFYVYRSVGYYTWSATASTTGSSLVFKRYADINNRLQVLTFKDRLAILNNMIDALYEDEDATTMGGDIEKRFGSSNLYSVVDTPEDYICRPMFDENALGQIENSVAYTTYTDGALLEESDNDSLDITQDNLIITSGIPKATVAVTGALTIPQQVIFNSHKDSPDYRDTLEWTRLSCGGQPIGNSGTMNITSFGLELVETYTIVYNSSSVSSSGDLSDVVVTGNNVAYTDTSIEQFDWHPIVYTWSFGGPSSGPITGQIWFSGDLKKYTRIDYDTLHNIHEAAIAASFWAHDVYNAAEPEA